MADEKVLLDIDSRGVATVSLNNPDRRNAFDDAMILSLIRLFEQLGENREVRLVRLQGEGKIFCAGADLGWMKRMAAYSYEENLEDARTLARLFRLLNFLPQPTVARIQGGAFGGGVGLVACCDIPIAEESASFGLSEVRLGLIPATISPYVQAAIGERQCRRFFATGERFSGHKAEAIGLVSEAVPADGLDQAVEKLVDQLLACGPEAVVQAKSLALRPTGPITDELLESTSRAIAEIRVSEEGQEGLRAFFEKRTPAWRVSDV